MSTTASITLTMAYSGTDKTRKYQLTDVEIGSLSSVKAKVIAYNANLSETDKSIFISDDYDENTGVGKLASISAASYEVVDYTRINLN